jgi:tetratricopeptide (TPR) repeat protein
MRKIVLAVVLAAPLTIALAQQEPRQLVLPTVPGEPSETGNKPGIDPIANYKNAREAALAAFQAGYTAAIKGQSPERAMRLFLIALHRDAALPRALYNLGVLCTHDREERWEDAINFQREAQRWADLDPETAKLAGTELERLQAIVDIESSPTGKRDRRFDIQFHRTLNSGKDAVGELLDLEALFKLDNKRWEAHALAGILHAQSGDFAKSLNDFEEAARLAPPSRGRQLQSAADLARKESNFKEQKNDADELWEKQQYEPAAKHYATAWEDSPGRLDVGLQAATAFLMADQAAPAVAILSHMRDSAPPEVDAKVVAMLNALGDISEEAKRAAAHPQHASVASSSVDVASNMRALVGPLTSPQMELVARAAPPLLEDTTSIIPMPDEDLTGAHANTPFLSTEKIFAIYKSDPASAAGPPPAPEANPATNPVPEVPAPLAPPPTPVQPADLPTALPPRPGAELVPAPGERVVQVVSDPPGASIVFDGNSRLHCLAPCPISLSPDRHVLHATLAGYHDADKILMVDKGKKQETVNVVLEAKRGLVRIESSTPGAAIYVDGKKTDKQTPAQLSLAEGEYDIAVEIDGKMVTKKIPVRDGDMRRVPF